MQDGFWQYVVNSSGINSQRPNRVVVLVIIVWCFQPAIIESNDTLLKSVDSNANSLITESSGWVHNFSARRELYVSTLASESGRGAKSDPITLETAIASAQPGDLYWMMRGLYKGAYTLSKNGTEDSPIVFRAMVGHHVIVEGALKVEGAYTWIWGLEITDPEDVAPFSGIDIFAPGVHVINNVIHDHKSDNGIGAWDTGPGQVVYGNILYMNGIGQGHPHNIYTQNNYDKRGYKYFINNLVLDSADVCGNCFNFHAYTEKGHISGFYLLNNVFSNGRFLIGGFNRPADNEVVIENYFYESQVQFGYRRPVQATFTKNTLFRSTLGIEWFWGDGEAHYAQTKPNTFTGNRIVNPPHTHIVFRTSAYITTDDGIKRSEGTPRIQPTDIVDDNVYSKPFRASFEAGGLRKRIRRLSDWRLVTANAGNAFDVHSEIAESLREVEISILQNEYDPERSILVILNWSRQHTVFIDMSEYYHALETDFCFYEIKAINKYPLLCSSGDTAVSIPTGGKEFALLFVSGIQSHKSFLKDERVIN